MLQPRTLLVVCILALTGLASPAFAAGPSAEQRAEFQQLVAERNRLHQQLEALDRQAADRLKRDEDAMDVHARQITAQDQLDQVQLRLDVLALRHDLSVPPLAERASESGEPVSQDRGERKGEGEQAFARGHERALEHLRRDARRMLASLDFTAFLAASE